MQSAVNEQSSALIGLKGNLSLSKVMSYAAEGAIKIGRFCSLGTDKEAQVLIPAAAGSITSIFAKRGVALHSHARENAQDGLDPQYADKETVSVMTKGDVYVEVEADVDPTDEVWVRHTVDSSLDQLGIFAPATGTGLSQLADARWLRVSETIDGKKVALLELL